MILVGTCKEHFNDLCNCTLPLPSSSPSSSLAGAFGRSSSRMRAGGRDDERRLLPPVPHANLGAAVREMLPLECQNDAEAVRDFQAEWLREQDLITSDSVLDAVRLARGTDHARRRRRYSRGARRSCSRRRLPIPRAYPGTLVANARLRFDELMRRNIQ